MSAGEQSQAINTREGEAAVASSAHTGPSSINTCTQTLVESSVVPLSLTRVRLYHPCGDEAMESSMLSIKQYTVTQEFHSREASSTPNSNSSYCEYNGLSIVSKKMHLIAFLPILQFLHSCYTVFYDAPEPCRGYTYILFSHHPISALSPVRSLCIRCYPLQREVSLTKAESSTNPWVQS